MMLFEALKTVPKEEKPLAGKALNSLKIFLENEIQKLKDLAFQDELQKKIQERYLDISLPSEPVIGSLHPITLIRKKIIKIFCENGFSVYDSPETDFDDYNFTRLNIPEHHPSRDMQDTFFIKKQDPLSPNLVLRTHTSNTQIHAMLQEEPPLRIVVPGRVYRVDNDATHSPMFHQIEAVVVDEGISFAHLKGIIQTFTYGIFGEGLKTRFRASYFPFVEPGAEVDVECPFCHKELGSVLRLHCKTCKHTGWIEIGGSGMIHPNVFKSVHYDCERYTGYAFGFGLDRMTMVAYGLNDLRLMFEGLQTFQSQFPIY
jgi:phenylalanyl-tRNA synthetase alpha chain